jgi:hypothetical protein
MKEWFKNNYFKYRFRFVLSLILAIVFMNTEISFYSEEGKMICKYFMETLIPLVITYMALITAFYPPDGIKKDPITRKAFLKEIYSFLLLTFIIPIYLTFYAPSFYYNDWYRFIFLIIYILYLLSALRNLQLLYHLHSYSWGSKNANS